MYFKFLTCYLKSVLHKKLHWKKRHIFKEMVLVSKNVPKLTIWTFQIPKFCKCYQFLSCEGKPTFFVRPYIPVPGLYWAADDSIGPVLSRYWHITACLWGWPSIRQKKKNFGSRHPTDPKFRDRPYFFHIFFLFVIEKQKEN